MRPTKIFFAALAGTALALPSQSDNALNLVARQSSDTAQPTLGRLPSQISKLFNPFLTQIRHIAERR